MKMEELTMEHLSELRKKEFVYDIEEIKKMGLLAAERIQKRIENDNAIVYLSEFFARKIETTSILPPGFRSQAIRNAIINCIIEWENINEEFNQQTK